MERHFDQELRQLRTALTQMSGRAEEMARKSVVALRERNALLASELPADDHELDRLEVAVQERCFTLLALRQPMATDLRLIASSFQMATDLERVGDHAINIGRSVGELARLPEAAPPGELDRLADVALAMLKSALDAFQARDAEAARETCVQDDQADALEDQALRILQERMVAEPASVPTCVQYILVARNLERIADLATNVAEEAIFVVQARVIKHHLEETP